MRNVFPGSGFNAATLDGAVDMSSLTAIGHSFGGSTVVAAIANDTAGGALHYSIFIFQLNIG